MIGCNFERSDEWCSELVIEFLNSKALNGVNGFNKEFLISLKFNSNGHPRWDFTFNDEKDYTDKDSALLVSLNLAWDCYFEGCIKI